MSVCVSEEMVSKKEVNKHNKHITGSQAMHESQNKYVLN